MKHTRTMTGLLAVALMAMMVSDVMAQGRRPGGGQQGGRGGPGGFGQRGGPGGFGGGDPVFGLLRIDEVKEEIELMPDQDAAVQKLVEQNRPQFGGRDGEDRPNFREMSDDERTAFFERMRKEGEERAKKMREQLEEVLVLEQIERLDQIALQMQGARALRDEKVAAKLKITPDQKTKMEEVEEQNRQEMRSKMQELFQSDDRDGMREAMTKMREDSEKKILAVLNSSQLATFEEMKGKKFDMPEQRGFGGGRGGFGGPGGRGGPGGGGPGGGGGRRGRPPVEE